MVIGGEGLQIDVPVRQHPDGSIRVRGLELQVLAGLEVVQQRVVISVGVVIAVGTLLLRRLLRRAFGLGLR